MHFRITPMGILCGMSVQFGNMLENTLSMRKVCEELAFAGRVKLYTGGSWLYARGAQFYAGGAVI
jgi:hypothetical protein